MGAKSVPRTRNTVERDEIEKTLRPIQDSSQSQLRGVWCCLVDVIDVVFPGKVSEFVALFNTQVRDDDPINTTFTGFSSHAVQALRQTRIIVTYADSLERQL